MFDYIASEPLALKACDASAIPVPPTAKPKDGAEFILVVNFSAPHQIAKSDAR